MSPSSSPAGAPTEGELLAAKLEALVAAHPQLRPEGRIVDGQGFVRFGRAEPDGFDVGVDVTPGGIVVHAELAHVHVDEGSAEARATAAVRWVVAMLGPDVRLRERLAGGRPVRARLEWRSPRGWETLTTTGLLFWNYLARRGERIRQNRTVTAAPV